MLLILVITIILYFLLKYRKRFYISFKLPGPWFIPLIGTVQLATMKPEGVFQTIDELRIKYQKTFHIWLGPNLWVFLHTADEVKQALNNPDLNRPDEFQQLKIIIGNGLLLSTGKKWSSHRKVLNPAFHHKILENFMEKISKHTDILLDVLEKHEKCEISDFFFHCILDIICDTSMGAEINSQGNSNCLYAQAFHDAMHLLWNKMVNPILGFDFIYQRTTSFAKLKKSIRIIHELTDKVIKDKQINISQLDAFELTDDIGIKRKMVLLDTLLKSEIDGKPFSNNDIRDEVNTFLFAGVDTTKSAMSFIAYNLGKYKKFQEQVRSEILSKIPSSEDNDYIISLEDLKELKILDQFIKESQRIYTTVPLTGRRNCISDTKIGDIIYPKDTTIWINMYGLSHDPDIYPNPNEFQIDRFDSTNEIQPYTYLPYSAGLHNCIGKRYADIILRVITIKLLKKYEISLQNPDEKLNLITEMVLKSTNGINLILKRI